MAKTKTNVTICGKEYSIVSDDSKEHVHRVAMYLDDKMKELNREYISLNATMLTTLAALNIADELMKTQDILATIQSEVEGLREAMRDMHIRQRVGDGDSEDHRIKEALRRMQAEDDKKSAKVTPLKEMNN